MNLSLLWKPHKLLPRIGWWIRNKYRVRRIEKNVIRPIIEGTDRFLADTLSEKALKPPTQVQVAKGAGSPDTIGGKTFFFVKEAELKEGDLSDTSKETYVTYQVRCRSSPFLRYLLPKKKNATAYSLTSQILWTLEEDEASSAARDKIEDLEEAKKIEEFLHWNEFGQITEGIIEQCVGRTIDTAVLEAVDQFIDARYEKLQKDYGGLIIPIAAKDKAGFQDSARGIISPRPTVTEPLQESYLFFYQDKSGIIGHARCVDHIRGHVNDVWKHLIMREKKEASAESTVSNDYSRILGLTRKEFEDRTKGRRLEWGLKANPITKNGREVPRLMILVLLFDNPTWFGKPIKRKAIGQIIQQDFNPKAPQKITRKQVRKLRATI